MATKILVRKANVLSQIRWKLQIFKSCNAAKLKLEILNEISNELCRTIDTANILFESKLYVKHRATFSEVIESVQRQFNSLNSDSVLYNQCLDIQYLRQDGLLDLDVNDKNSSRGQFCNRMHQLTTRTSSREKSLQKEDKQFLKIILGDYDLRYFISRNEHDKAELHILQKTEGQLLQQLRQNCASSKMRLALHREDFYSFEVPPDSYIGYMQSMNRQTNVIELDLPASSSIFLLKNCNDPQLRSKLFENLTNSAKQNEALLLQLMETRQQLAIQLGFRDFQQYSLALNSKFFGLDALPGVLREENNRDRMIQIQRILNSAVDRCHTRLASLFSDPSFYASILERAYLTSPLKEQGVIQLAQLIPNEQLTSSKQVVYSDLVYLRQKVLSTPLYKFILTWKETLRLLTYICSRFLDVELRECAAPRNHFFNTVVNESEVLPQESLAENIPEKNMRCFEVIGVEGVKGIVYIDFNAYEDAKTCFSSGYCELNAFRQLPCVLVRMNFKIMDEKSELTFDNLQTLMHEMGHVMHSLLNKHPYQLLANNYKIDYAEICAKIFENLVFLCPEQCSMLSDKQIMQYLDLFRSMSQLEQVYYAKLDLFLHEKKNDNSPSLHEFSTIIQKNIFKSLLTNNDNYWFCNLSHLDEYSGLYFSYALGEEIFSEMHENDLSFDECKLFLSRLFTSAHL